MRFGPMHIKVHYVNTPYKVVTGHRFLGGFLGSHSGRDEYVMSKVCKWVGYVDVLAEAAVTQTQLAYAAVSRPFPVRIESSVMCSAV